jgi:hypothetical protein
MNPAARVLLTVTSILATAALAGCGEKEEPAIARPSGSNGDTSPSRECQAGTKDHAFDRARLVNGGRVLRVAYVDSGSLQPCTLGVRYGAGSIRVTVRVPDPRAQTNDLHYWCAEGRLPEAAAEGVRLVSDPEARQRIRGSEAQQLNRILRTGRSCIRVPVEELG